jgi:hypothetical protein
MCLPLIIAKTVPIEVVFEDFPEVFAALNYSVPTSTKRMVWMLSTYILPQSVTAITL